MSTTITATLIFDNSDPPRATINVQINGDTVANRELTPAEAVAAIAVLAPETQEVWAPAQAVLTALHSAVDQGAAAQVVRERALQDWQAALTSAPSTTGQ